MFESGQKRPKIQVEIEVHLQDGSFFLGMLSLAQGQRVSDLMNDERQFLPIERVDGSVVIYRKAVISKVLPSAAPSTTHTSGSPPAGRGGGSKLPTTGAA